MNPPTQLPGYTLLVGENLTTVMDELQQQGKQTCWYHELSTLYGYEWNCVVFSQHWIESQPDLEVLHLIETLGYPSQIIILVSDDWFSSDQNIPFLLLENGYRRNFSTKDDSGQQNWICFTRDTSVHGSAIIQDYENHVYFLNQLAQKQRELLIEYRNEVTDESFRFLAKIAEKDFQLERQKNEINDLNIRWDSFWMSRTGKTLRLLQKIRQKVIPRRGKIEKFIQSILNAVRVIRREGFFYFLKALPRRVAFRLRKLFIQLRYRFGPRGAYGSVVDIEAVIPRVSDLVVHQQSVDVIICVHNALEDVQRCLASVERATNQPYRLILVDDGSAKQTAEFLQHYCETKGNLLLRSDEATGYTRAANRGMRESTGNFVVLLNSDTIVSPHWLDGLIACANSDPKIGMVGPLSNTASWQSIPKIEDHGDWAINPLPEGLTVDDMAALVRTNSGHLYPEMPLLNGFCLMIKREAINSLGIFDEESFGAGYGEEDDYALRLRHAGWKLALADDVYIYHAQSKSYSTERRKNLSERAGKILISKHGADVIQESVQICHQSRLLEGIRARSSMLLQREKDIEVGKRYSGRKLLFILPVASPGGGANVIRTEAQAMRKMQVEVEFFNLSANQQRFETAYPAFEFPVVYGEVEDIPHLSSRYDAVIATYNPSVGWMRHIPQLDRKPVRGYYVQGFEPLMYPEKSVEYERALQSYTMFSDLVCFTKTNWTREMVNHHTGQNCHIVGISLDIDLYRPRHQITATWPIRPIRIAAMIRPEAPYREPLKTMKLLKMASDTYGGRIEVCIFGTQQDNTDFLQYPINFPWKLYGVLPQEKVANLLSQTDIFIDYSSHQAMGLTALEAMACGNAVIVPLHGGAVEFAIHERNSLVVDTSEFENVWLALKRLIDDENVRSAIQKNAVFDASKYYPERAALNILGALFGDS